MYLVLGDWSDDGHGKSEKVLMSSNVPVEDVQQAYKDACKLTTVSFNDNENYTGVKRDYKEEADWQIATNYEEPYIGAKAYENLKEFGIEEFLNEFGGASDYLKNYQNDDGSVNIEGNEMFIKLWSWFIKLANPKITICRSKSGDSTPCINGYWDKNLNVQFGYGLYN